MNSCDSRRNGLQTACKSWGAAAGFHLSTSRHSSHSRSGLWRNSVCGSALAMADSIGNTGAVDGCMLPPIVPTTRRRGGSSIAGRAPVHGWTDGRARGFRRAVGFCDGLPTFHVGDATAVLCSPALGLVSSSSLTGISAAGLPIWAFILGHWLSPLV